MDTIQLVFENIQPVLTILGGIVGIFSLTVPFLKPQTTRKVGNAIGTLLKVLRQRKPQSVREFKRIATTAHELIEGILEKI